MPQMAAGPRMPSQAIDVLSIPLAEAPEKRLTTGDCFIRLSVIRNGQAGFQVDFLQQEGKTVTIHPAQIYGGQLVR